MRLSGKTALITGAASGFGAGIARRFAQEGARVIVADLNTDGAIEIATEIDATAVTMDVSSGSDWTAVAEHPDTATLDILVNNAGITHPRGNLEDIEEADFDKVLAVNAKSVFWSAKYIVPRMKARRSGAILNVASTAAISPRPQLNWYNASKGWMLTATKTMAIELAAFGIRVNALNPVLGATGLTQAFMGDDSAETRAKFLATIPLGRMSTPEDMGHAAVFLCSDEASMITGVGLEVDGGRCI